MMREKITEALKDAMRSRNEAVTTTIRMVNAAIKQKDIDVARPRGDEAISDEEILNLLHSQIKSRRDAIELFRKGERPDLVEKEEAEIALIQQFLPKQLSENELQEAVRAVVASVGAAGIKDMGKVMAELKTKYAGKLDMSKAGAVVKQALSGR